MGQKILLVDDDPLVVMLFEQQLARVGYSVCTAGCGKEGLAAAEREKPDLIVMDIVMADLNGLAAVRQLKKNDGLKQVPVVVITSQSAGLEAFRKEAVVAGAAGFLVKPFGAAQLIAEIQKLLGPAV
jgi:CheY-like chemotaxis protein